MGSMMTSLLVPFANAGDGGAVVLAVWAAVTLLAAVVLYVLCPPKAKASGPRGVRSFFSFDRRCMVSATRFVYLFGSVGGLTFLAASVVVLFFLGNYAEPPVGYLAALVAVVAVFEVLLRIVCELVVAVARMAEDTAALRDGVDGLASHVSQLSCDRGSLSAEAERLVGELGAQVGALAAHVAATAVAASPSQPAEVPAEEPPRAPQASGDAEEPPSPVAGGAQDVPHGAGAVAPGSFGPEAAGAPVETAQPPAAGIRYEEIPAVFDATTYDEFASRGAFGPYEEPSGPVPAPYLVPPEETYGYGYPAWDCACGSRGNTGAFCGNCGRPRPR